MNGSLTASSSGPGIATLPSGPQNAITDVDGVRVGHCTVTDPADSAVQTGVTVVVPAARQPVPREARRRVPRDQRLRQVGRAASGRGARPARVADRADQHAVRACGHRGAARSPARRESRDRHDDRLGQRGRPASATTVFSTTSAAATSVASTSRTLSPTPAPRVVQGAVGAGRGMSAYGLKGGIGTASRVVEAPGSAQPSWACSCSRTSAGSPELIDRRPAGRRRARPELRADPDPLGAGSRDRRRRHRRSAVRAPARPAAPPRSEWHRPDGLDTSPPGAARSSSGSRRRRGSRTSRPKAARSRSSCFERMGP